MKIPVIFAAYDLGDGVSGVTSRLSKIKTAFAGDDIYRVIMLNVGQNAHLNASLFDYWAPDAETARRLLSSLFGGIIIPNWAYELFALSAELNKEGGQWRCIGYCCADSEEEYYSPLVHYEPMIERFVAVSRECKTGLDRRLPDRATEIAVLETPVVLPALVSRAYSVRPIRVMYAGRLVQKQKRVFDFISLVQHLYASKVDFNVEIIGDGPDRKALENGLLEVDTGGRVSVSGPYAPHEMSHFWQRCDVFVQASGYEGMSNSLLEAMAHGAVPVITDAGSGVHGVVDPEVNGFVVEVGDMRAMAERIALLGSSPSRLEAMGRAAQVQASKFGLDGYKNKLKSLLDEVCAKPVRQWPSDHPLRPAGIRAGMSLGQDRIKLDHLSRQVASLIEDVQELERHYWSSPLFKLERFVGRMLNRRFRDTRVS